MGEGGDYDYIERGIVLNSRKKRILAAILLVVAILAVAALVTAQGRTAVKTALFLPQVLPTIPVKPQEWFTGDPGLEEVSYPTENGFGVADLYTPAGRRQAWRGSAVPGRESRGQGRPKGGRIGGRAGAGRGNRADSLVG